MYFVLPTENLMMKLRIVIMMMRIIIMAMGETASLNFGH
jgi:hypothetical protein